MNTLDPIVNRIRMDWRSGQCRHYKPRSKRLDVLMISRRVLLPVMFERALQDPRYTAYCEKMGKVERIESAMRCNAEYFAGALAT